MYLPIGSSLQNGTGGWAAHRRTVCRWLVNKNSDHGRSDEDVQESGKKHRGSTDFVCHRGELRTALSPLISNLGDVKWTRADESTATAFCGSTGHGTTAAILYCGRPAHFQHASTKTWRHGVNGRAVTSWHTGASLAAASFGEYADMERGYVRPHELSLHQLRCSRLYQLSQLQFSRTPRPAPDLIPLRA